MKRFFFFVVCVFYLINCFSQNRNNIWYFGDNAGINFNTNPPSALNNSAMTAWEGCSTICDNNGNILFYTDGDTVWNRNHLKMPNGFGLDAGWHNSSTQGTLIIPKPCNNSIYYIFTVTEAEAYPNTNFSYSIVDITLDAGLGDVTNKNVHIHHLVTEKLTATLQATA